jgi:hypothetical protein
VRLRRPAFRRPCRRGHPVGPARGLLLPEAAGRPKPVGPSRCALLHHRPPPRPRRRDYQSRRGVLPTVLSPATSLPITTSPPPGAAGTAPVPAPHRSPRPERRGAPLAAALTARARRAQELVVAVTAGGEVHVLTHTRDRPLQPSRTVPLPCGPGAAAGRLLRAAWLPHGPRSLRLVVAPDTGPGRGGVAVSTWQLPERAGPSEPAVGLRAPLPAAVACAACAAHDADLCAVACEVGPTPPPPPIYARPHPANTSTWTPTPRPILLRAPVVRGAHVPCPGRAAAGPAWRRGRACSGVDASSDGRHSRHAKPRPMPGHAGQPPGMPRTGGPSGTRGPAQGGGARAQRAGGAPRRTGRGRGGRMGGWRCCAGPRAPSLPSAPSPPPPPPSSSTRVNPPPRPSPHPRYW